MIPKKQMKDGEMVDEAEIGNAVEAAQPDKDEGQKAGVAPKPDAAVKPQEAPRKAEPAKAEPAKAEPAKPQMDPKAQAKPKPKAEEAAVAAKPAEPKSLAEVMKFDLRAKRRRRF